MIGSKQITKFWISFTVVAILALSAIGVGMGSARILPEDVLLFFYSVYSIYYCIMTTLT